MIITETDQAIKGNKKFAMGYEPTYSGVLSLFRRAYTRDLTGADIVTWGIPYDLAVTNRPGSRFGPRSIRAVSTNLAWDGGPWPWGFDPFESLCMLDYGDCYFDPGTPLEVADAIYSQAKEILQQAPFLISMGGDHSVSYPLLKAHADKHGPLALIQVDAHSDTWEEPEKRVDHGTMFYHAIGRHSDDECQIAWLHGYRRKCCAYQRNSGYGKRDNRGGRIVEGLPEL